MKSRILFEQMLGRGTRKGEKFPDKSHFTVFDCFDGTLLEYFRNATGITAEPPEDAGTTIAQIIEDIWQNRDRDYNIRCLVKRLQRIDKEMSGEARELFAALHPRRRPRPVRRGAAGDASRRLRRHDEAPARRRTSRSCSSTTRGRSATFIVAHERRRTTVVVRVADPRRRRAGVQARGLPGGVRAVRPRERRRRSRRSRSCSTGRRTGAPTPLTELRQKLAQAPEHFTEDNLQKAHSSSRYHKALVDIISMVKHAADDSIAAAHRRGARRRSRRPRDRRTARFTDEQQRVAGAHPRSTWSQNLSIDRDDFDDRPGLSDRGGWGRGQPGLRRAARRACSTS